MESSRQDNLIPTDINFLVNQTDVISSQHSFKKNLGLKTDYLCRLRDGYLKKYIEVYDRKIENSLAIRLNMKLKVEAERVLFMLKIVRNNLLSTDSSLIEELFKDFALDLELEKGLCAIYNLMENANFTWIQIYEIFDTKKFLSKLIFAPAGIFNREEIRNITHLNYQSWAEMNPQYKKVILMIFQLIILYEKHYSFCSQIDKLNQSILRTQKNEFVLEKKEVDLRDKISKLTNFIESVEQKAQIVDEEMEITEVEVEIKKNLLAMVQEKGEILTAYIPESNATDLNLLDKDVDEYAIQKLPSNIKVHFKLKPFGKRVEKSKFSLKDFIESEKQEKKDPTNFRSNGNEIHQKNADLSESDYEDEDEYFLNQTAPAKSKPNLDEETLKRNQKTKGLDLQDNNINAELELNFGKFQEETNNNIQIDQVVEIQGFDAPKKINYFGKCETSGFKSNNQLESKNFCNRDKRRNTETLKEGLSFELMLRQKFKTTNLLLKSLYLKKFGEKGSQKTFDPFWKQSTGNSQEQTNIFQFNKVNFDTFQNQDAIKESRKASRRDLSLPNDELENEYNNEFAYKGFDFLKQSFHAQYVNYNDFQIMTNSHLLSENKQNASVVYDDFLKEIDEEIKKYDQLDLNLGVQKPIGETSVYHKSAGEIPTDFSKIKDVSFQSGNIKFNKKPANTKGFDNFLRSDKEIIGSPDIDQRQIEENSQSGPSEQPTSTKKTDERTNDSPIQIFSEVDRNQIKSLITQGFDNMTFQNNQQSFQTQNKQTFLENPFQKKSNVFFLERNETGRQSENQTKSNAVNNFQNLSPRVFPNSKPNLEISSNFAYRHFEAKNKKEENLQLSKNLTKTNPISVENFDKYFCLTKKLENRSVRTLNKVFENEICGFAGIILQKKPFSLENKEVSQTVDLIGSENQMNLDVSFRSILRRNPEIEQKTLKNQMVPQFRRESYFITQLSNKEGTKNDFSTILPTSSQTSGGYHRDSRPRSTLRGVIFQNAIPYPQYLNSKLSKSEFIPKKVMKSIYQEDQNMDEHFEGEKTTFEGNNRRREFRGGNSMSSMKKVDRNKSLYRSKDNFQKEV